MKAETKFEMKKRLQRELVDLTNDRAELESQRSQPGVEFDEFLRLSNLISAISVKQYTAKYKIHQLENNRPLLGNTLPNHSTSDMLMQGRGGMKKNN
jgi:hypothetical protein